MRFIETIKIVAGECLNMEYHCRRAGFAIPQPIIGEGFRQGIVKWRIVYGDGLPIESQMSNYVKPRITSLTLVDGQGIEYSKKYENRSEIDGLRALRGSCDDVLIIRNGMVSDTSFCNIVFENESGLFTPSTPLLKGTKRQRLIDEGIIIECPIKASDIPKYRRAYLINAMIELGDKLCILTEDIR